MGTGFGLGIDLLDLVLGTGFGILYWVLDLNWVLDLVMGIGLGIGYWILYWVLDLDWVLGNWVFGYCRTGFVMGIIGYWIW